MVASRRRQAAAGVELERDAGDYGVNLLRGDFLRARKRTFSIAETFADNLWLIGLSVKNIAQLVFDQRSFLFDHDQPVQISAKRFDAIGIDRPHQPQFQNRQRYRTEPAVAIAALAQALFDILVRLAGGNNTDAGSGIGLYDLVQAMQAGVTERIRQAYIEQALLAHQRRPAHRLQRCLFGQLDGGWIPGYVDRAAALDDVGHQLHADHAAAVSAHRDPVQSKIEYILRIGGVEHGNAGGDEIGIREIDHGRRSGAVIVAGEREDAAVPRGARVVSVA